MCIRVSACRFHAVCSPLGNERPETKPRGSRKGRGERQRRKRNRERKKKKKKSKDRPVTRIGFKTVSNDTGQDMTATVMWSRESFYHRRHPSLFPALKSPKMELFGGHRSHGDKEGTVSRETSAELHACVLRFVILFRRNIPRNLFRLRIYSRWRALKFTGEAEYRKVLISMKRRNLPASI